MLWRLLTVAIRSWLTIERKVENLKWRRIQHGEEPHIPDDPE